MRARRLAAVDGVRLYAAVFEAGDDVLAGLVKLARDEDLATAGLTAIGGFRRAAVGWFDPDLRDYRRIEIDEQVEVLSLLGDITRSGAGRDRDAKAPTVHAHVVLARRDGSTTGGHLLEATVRPTLEVIVTAAPEQLPRRHDPASGLALIDLALARGGPDGPHRS